MDGAASFWGSLAAEGITVGPTSVHRYLEALGLTRKKRRSTHRSRSAPTSPRPGRRGGKPSRTLNPARLVFIDGTWIKTNMARPYGRDPCGHRLVASVLHGHWTTSTFLAALRHDTITAPCVIDGPINGETLSNSSWCRP